MSDGRLEGCATWWHHALGWNRLCQMSNHLLNDGRIVQNIWTMLLRRFLSIFLLFVVGGNIRIFWLFFLSEGWCWCGLIVCSTVAGFLTADRLIFTRCDRQHGLWELNDILLGYLLLKHVIVGQRSFFDRKFQWVEYFITFSLLEKEIIIVDFRTLLMIRVHLSISVKVLNRGRIRICLLLHLLLLLLLFLLVS